MSSTVAAMQGVAAGLGGIAFVFLILVLPHELGHFGVARLLGLQVPELGLGLGPRLVAGRWGATTYTLRAFPVGGYVVLSETCVGWLRQLLVLIGGPLANGVVSVLLITAVLLSQADSPPGQVAAVDRGGPASRASVQPGDTVESVDGREVTSQARLAETTTPVTLAVRRPDGSRFAVRVVASTEYGPEGREQLGITTPAVPSPGQAVAGGLLFPVIVVGAVAAAGRDLVGGRLAGGALGPNGLVSPIGLGDLAYQAALRGWQHLLTLAALLSVMVALTNLVPLPVLDGGRIIGLALEGLSGRRLSPRLAGGVERLTLAVLVAFMVVLALVDLKRILTGSFPDLP